MKESLFGLMLYKAKRRGQKADFFILICHLPFAFCLFLNHAQTAS